MEYYEYNFLPYQNKNNSIQNILRIRIQVDVFACCELNPFSSVVIKALKGGLSNN